jgi:AcrR family transcriptional regulator
MSSESNSPSKRKYRKRRRAELEDETRLRITEAAVELHGSVGPARTTISAVAERAGVQRATLYRHFPDEEALFDACSSHWAAQNPLPDLAEWAAIANPEERLRTALSALYAWYEKGQGMLEKTTRDAGLVPAMQPAVERMGRWFSEAVATIVDRRPERGAQRRGVEAAVGHAVSFATWRSLVRDQGLSNPEAVDLMRGLTALAAAK